MPLPSRHPELPLKYPEYTEPLCSVGTAKGLLRLHEWQVGTLVDDGSLLAFDIRLPKAQKRELRILTASVTARLQRPEAPAGLTLPEAITLVLAAVGHEKPWLTGLEIKGLINCSRQHVINLVACGELPAAPSGRARRGPGGSPVVARETFARWLSGRLA